MIQQASSEEIIALRKKLLLERGVTKRAYGTALREKTKKKTKGC